MSILSFSQQKNVKIANLQPQSEDFIFPVISYREKPLVENKINTFLQVSELEYIPNSGKNPFQLASTATNSYANYVYFYEWKKLETPENILSISMNGEASGAYPEGFDNWRNFDLRTGNLINLEQLFSEKGKEIIADKIALKIKKEITDYLKELKTEKPKNKEEKETNEDQIALYEDCLQTNTVYFKYLKFYFGKDKITFVQGRCSNHAMRALDDLDTFSIEFSYKDLLNYWSPFAKNLLSGSSSINAPESIQNKLFKGEIDHKYPITVLFKEVYEDGSFSAVYWYNKSKKLIDWDGNLKNSHISITENDYHSEELQEWIPKAKIEADVKGKVIIGTWQDDKTKKILSLELVEM